MDRLPGSAALCRACGHAYSNPRPSAKMRRAHKKNCCGAEAMQAGFESGDEKKLDASHAAEVKKSSDLAIENAGFEDGEEKKFLDTSNLEADSLIPTSHDEELKKCSNLAIEDADAQKAGFSVDNELDNQKPCNSVAVRSANNGSENSERENSLPVEMVSNMVGNTCSALANNCCTSSSKNDISEECTANIIDCRSGLKPNLEDFGGYDHVNNGEMGVSKGIAHVDDENKHSYQLLTESDGDPNIAQQTALGMNSDIVNQSDDKGILVISDGPCETSPAENSRSLHLQNQSENDSVVSAVQPQANCYFEVLTTSDVIATGKISKECEICLDDGICHQDEKSFDARKAEFIVKSELDNRKVAVSSVDNGDKIPERESSQQVETISHLVGETCTSCSKDDILKDCPASKSDQSEPKTDLEDSSGCSYLIDEHHSYIGISDVDDENKCAHHSLLESDANTIITHQTSSGSKSDMGEVSKAEFSVQSKLDNRKGCISVAVTSIDDGNKVPEGENSQKIETVTHTVNDTCFSALADRGLTSVSKNDIVTKCPAGTTNHEDSTGCNNVNDEQEQVEDENKHSDENTIFAHQTASSLKSDIGNQCNAKSLEACSVAESTPAETSKQLNLQNGSGNELISPLVCTRTDCFKVLATTIDGVAIISETSQGPEICHEDEHILPSPKVCVNSAKETEASTLKPGCSYETNENDNAATCADNEQLATEEGHAVLSPEKEFLEEHRAIYNKTDGSLEPSPASNPKKRLNSDEQEQKANLRAPTFHPAAFDQNEAASSSEVLIPETLTVATVPMVTDKCGSRKKNTAEITDEHKEQAKGDIVPVVSRVNSDASHVSLRVLLAKAGSEAKSTSSSDRIWSSFRSRGSSKDDAHSSSKLCSPKLSLCHEAWSSPAKMPRSSKPGPKAGGKQSWVPFICCRSTC